MLQLALGTMRDLPRLQEITSVLIRHGLGDIVRRIGVSGALKGASDLLQLAASAEMMQLDPPVRVRMAMHHTVGTREGAHKGARVPSLRDGGDDPPGG